MEKVHLEHNRIRNIDVLTKLPALTWIDLRENCVDPQAVREALPNIDTLAVYPPRSDCDTP